MNESERIHVERCRAGDRSSFRYIVDTYQQMVFSLAFRMTCDEDEAKDIVQDTFLKAWMHIGGYDESRSLSTWLYTIASRLCLDRLRHRSFTVPLDGDGQALRRLADDDCQECIENAELASIIRSISRALSPMQRLTFTLCQMEGLCSDEVERITGLSAVQVKSNLYAARKAVRKRLTELGYE